MRRLVEFQTYQLVPGSGRCFHDLVEQQSVPLQKKANMDVVAYRQSEHDADAYVLIRAYVDLAHLQESQALFYASPAWREGPREAIVGLILSDAKVVLCLSDEAIAALRQT